MAGIIYLIRNGDLHKIGTTKNLQRRMKELKPDKIIRTLERTDYREIEKELHQRYKDVRLPQSEYFRLTERQLEDCIKRLSRPFPWMTIVWVSSGVALAIAIALAIYTNIPGVIKDFKRVKELPTDFIETFSSLNAKDNGRPRYSKNSVKFFGENNCQDFIPKIIELQASAKLFGA